MGFGGTQLCLCLLLAFAVISSSARNTILFSDDELVVAMEMEGRSLRVTTNDYNDPTANRGHDPSPASSRVKSRGDGGRKG
ncbi:protein PSY3-like [Pyrus communis]|uniref:protein PSY3-like n=1 Tax=Pyrus communis TaxID=23211 RepID=UPI0035C227C4